MGRSTKESWLSGPGDLQESEVEDTPVKGESVLVRGLPAAYSNDAVSESLTLKTSPNGEQITVIDQTKLEVLQFHHGVVEPAFSKDEARTVAERFGPAFKKVIARIDELSGVDKEAIERANAKFPAGERSENGTATTVEDGASVGSG